MGLIKQKRSHLSLELTINYNFPLNKPLIWCLVIVSQVVVIFGYGVGLRDLKYGHSQAINMCKKTWGQSVNARIATSKIQCQASFGWSKQLH